jgi:uncharacterized protein YodC (DUF2158 family)
MHEHIRVGDAVTLKSGGPVMTVQALSMSLAYCAWRVGAMVHHGTFEVDSLELTERRATAHGELSVRGDDEGRSAS